MSNGKQAANASDARKRQRRHNVSYGPVVILLFVESSCSIKSNEII